MARLLKPPRKARACGNCQHFAPNGTAYMLRSLGGACHAVGEQTRGECRARPPKADRKTDQAVWPDVVGNDWCSAFAVSQPKSGRASV